MPKEGCNSRVAMMDSGYQARPAVGPYVDCSTKILNQLVAKNHYNLGPSTARQRLNVRTEIGVHASEENVILCRSSQTWLRGSWNRNWNRMDDCHAIRIRYSCMLHY